MKQTRRGFVSLRRRLQGKELKKSHQRMPSSKFQSVVPVVEGHNSSVIPRWRNIADAHLVVTEHPPDLQFLVPLSANLTNSHAAWLRYPHGFIQVRMYPRTKPIARQRVHVGIVFTGANTEARPHFSWQQAQFLTLSAPCPSIFYHKGIAERRLLQPTQV